MLRGLSRTTLCPPEQNTRRTDRQDKATYFRNFRNFRNFRRHFGQGARARREHWCKKRLKSRHAVQTRVYPSLKW